MVSLTRRSKRSDRSRNHSPESSPSEKLASSTELQPPPSSDTDRPASPTRHGFRETVARASASAPVGKLKDVFKPHRRAASPGPSRTSSIVDTDQTSLRSSADVESHATAIQSPVFPDTGQTSDLFQPSQPDVPLVSPVSRTKPTNLNVTVGEESIQQSSNAPRSTVPRVAAIRATPPSSPAPSTLVTPPTPVDQGSPTFGEMPSQQLAVDHSHQRAQSVLVDDVTPHLATAGQISHQRSRSASAATAQPSKLSQMTTSPLTPMIEERGAAYGSSKDGANAGFFSTMISAAQNAATSLSNTLPNPLANQPTDRHEEDTANGVSPSQLSSDPGAAEHDMSHSASSVNGAPLAKATLGNGNLEFEHLDGEHQVSRTSTLPVPHHGDVAGDQNHFGRDSRSSTDPPRPSANSISKASGRDPDLRIQTAVRATEPFPSATINSEDHSARTSRSRGVSAVTSTSSPGSLLGVGTEGSLGRSGSVKSRLARAGRNRRSGSVATNGGIAAGIVAVGAGLASTPTLVDSSRTGGFAVANRKRNRDFHTTFRTIPLDDDLIEDYGCAMQKEILLQGRMYVSVGHICFYSNIFGWVTQIAIGFDEIMLLEKRNTAVVFPNAIAIQTLHSKYLFASFISRDSVFDSLVALWKVGHPNLQITDGTVSLAKADSTNGRASRSRGDGEGDSDSSYTDDDDYSDDDDDYESQEETNANDLTEKSMSTPRKESTATSPGPDANRKSAATASSHSLPQDSAIKAGATAGAEQDFPGPKTHDASDCGDADKHYEKAIKDDIIPAPLGQVYSLMFGDQSARFMEKFMTENQKVTELQLENKTGLSMEHKSRVSSYIKPLGGSIGPSKTKCNVTEEVEQLDYEKAASVVITTLSPDVPSGNSFSVKTRYCLTWAEGNTTRVVVNCTIEWTAKSWLKSAIEKGAVDGQIGYAKDLFAAVTTATMAPKAGGPKNATGKPRRRKRQGAEANAATRSRHRSHHQNAHQDDAHKSRLATISEALLDGTGTVIDVVKPVFGGSLHGFIIIVLLLTLLIRQGRIASNVALDAGTARGSSPPSGDINHEIVWKAEEGELWNWLEDRVGLKRQAISTSKRPPKAQDTQKSFIKEIVAHEDPQEAIAAARKQLENLESAAKEKLAAVPKHPEIQETTPKGGPQSPAESLATDEE